MTDDTEYSGPPLDEDASPAGRAYIELLKTIPPFSTVNVTRCRLVRNWKETNALSS